MAKLTVVGPDHQPEAPAEPPKTLVAALDLDERSLLVKSRLVIASTIDAGVPPHTLAGLMTKLTEADRAIRAYDARTEADNASRNGEVEDGHFDASAV